MQITTDVNLTFLFYAVSESLINFVLFLVVLALRNVVSFARICFYQKRCCVSIHDYVKTLVTFWNYSINILRYPQLLKYDGNVVVT